MSLGVSVHEFQFAKTADLRAPQQWNHLFKSSSSYPDQLQKPKANIRIGAK
jgi:hypothetical protein